MHRSKIEVFVVDNEDDRAIYPQWRLIFSSSGDVLYAEKGHDAVPFEVLLHHPEITVVPPHCHWYMLDNMSMLHNSPSLQRGA